MGAIDIGSNTVLMTCGRFTERDELEVLFEGHEVARLSERLEDGKPLRPEAKGRVLRVLREFISEATHRGISAFMAAGTAAFRRAADGEAFAEEIQRETGIPVRILTGQEEARLSFLSAERDFGTSAAPLGMIDIGGGSTELVFGKKEHWISLPVGTVRLLEKFVTTHPIPDEQWQKVQGAIARSLEGAVKPKESVPPLWVAVAATPTALATLLQKLGGYDPKRIHGFKIARSDLETLVETLRRKSMKDREAMPGMLPKRAELLPIGGLILLEAMKFLGIREVRASDHGLRYGLLYEGLRK
jgi:exopolyphosphatase/guanosine-5'-triphosphate,3'-diphosphate pyrophosphatase